MQPKRLSVLGVGLLGGSLGLAVKSAIKDCHITGYAHRKETLNAALKLGAIDEGYDDPARAVRDADWVVLCTPVGILPSLLASIVPALRPGAIVTDVGSTKATVVRVADQLVPHIRFVGSHPMAGSEKRGVQFASADLYRGSVCILTPTEQTDPQALAQVDAFWKHLGMRTRQLSPDVHDRLICDVSHLPHALAAALVTMQQEPALDLVGKGFLDATRIAAGDGALWRDILIDNRENLLQSLGRLQTSLDELKTLLHPEKSAELKAWLDRASERRQSIQRQRDASG